MIKEELKLFTLKFFISHHDCLKKKTSTINVDEVFCKCKHNNERNENKIDEILLRRRRFVKFDIN